MAEQTITHSSPGQLETLRNNSNSWTIRKVSNENRVPIVIGNGGIMFGSKPPPELVDNVQRFNEGVKDVWGGVSIYGDNPGYNFGFRQPYVWTALTDSNTKKYIKRFDSRAFPIGSTIQDVERLGKLMLSGKGAFFSLTQFTLQQQNAFNETRIWNPLSIVTSAAYRGSLGLIPRPTRHIEGAGSSFLGNIAAGFKSALNLQSDEMKIKVPGIARKATDGDPIALSDRAKLAGIPQKGFVRGETGKDASTRFLSKWGSSSGSGSGDGNIFSKLGSALVNRLKSYIPSTKGKDGDWDVRVEYSDSADVFKTFLTSTNKSLYYSVNDVTYSPQSIHRFTNSTEYGEAPKYSPEPGKILPKNGNGLIEKQKLLSNGSFKVNGTGETVVGNKRADVNMTNVVKSSVTENHIETENIVGITDIGRWDVAFQKWKGAIGSNLNTPDGAGTFYHGGIKTYKQLSSAAKDAALGSGNIIYENRKFNSGDRSNKYSVRNSGNTQGKHDEYNALGILDGNIGNPPTEISYNNTSNDTIYFYFHDLINDKYIPFRANINAINESNAADWEEVKYMGRADLLYTYKGFSRELSFQFSACAMSIRELIPLWKRINYLSGLVRPSKYTDGNGSSLSDFMYPPLITFRIGDMYVDQPAIIRSVSINIPDDAQWETVRTKEALYQYLKGTHQEIGLNKVNSQQLPTKVDISVTVALMEKKRSIVSDYHFMDSAMLPDPPPPPAKTPAVITQSFNTDEMSQPSKDYVGLSPNSSQFTGKVGQSTKIGDFAEYTPTYTGP